MNANKPPLTLEHPAPEVSAVAPQRGHGERILFVDDEEQLVKLGERMLHRLGYTVEGERLVERALARFEREPNHFQLVVTDQSMPGLSGLDFATRIHAIRPDLPVVIASGHTLALTDEKVRLAGVREVLFKPYTLHDLAAAVHRHLSN